MQATRVPPKLEQPKTTAGLPVGPRELTIVGSGSVMGVLVFFSSLPFFARVGIAVGLVGISAAYALVRIGGRYTVEEYLLHRLGYAQRVRRRTRGGAGAASPSGRLEREEPSPEPVQAAVPRRAWFTIPAEKVPSNSVMVANAIGLALLAAFIAWLGGGGLADLMVLRSSVLYLR